MKYFLPAFALLMLISGCAPQERVREVEKIVEVEKKEELNYKARLHQKFPTPYNVEKLREVGENWATFEYDGKRFLMYYKEAGDRSAPTMSVAQLIEEK